MENEGGNNNEQSRSNIRARRNWSELEEETLLTILEEMVVAGNKGENGTFKPGTHEEICKRKHPKVGNHVNKEFKEFEKLQGIFGKDRANGRVAEGFVDAMENEIGENQAGDDDEWLHQHDNSPASIGNTYVEPPSKRPRIAQLATRFLESFDGKMDVMANDFAKVVAKLPEPSKLAPSKRDLVEEIKKLGLTEEEEIDLVIKFSHNQQYEKFFWEFEGSQRMSFVRKVMRM